MEDAKLTTKDGTYIERKKEAIKSAAKAGNDAEAHRHAVELMQYLGYGDNETPIDQVVEDVT